MGSVQKEWLVYFYEADEYPYSDWLQFLKKGFKHCGAISYNSKHDSWIHLEYTHAGIRLSHLDKKESRRYVSLFKTIQSIKMSSKRSMASY